MTPSSNAVNPFAAFDLAALLEQRARQRGSHPFLVWAPFDEPSQTWSYAQFAEAAARIAGGLAARGVKPGDRVLVQLENCPEALLTLFACARLGAIHVPVNALAAGPELAWYAAFTGAVGAVTQPRLAAALASHCPDLQWLAITETDAGSAAAASTLPERALSFKALYGEALPPRAPDPTAPALIMFTSGTTSRPKGVLWTHANALWGGRLGALQQGLRADDVYQLFLPLFHVVALSWSFLPALWAGATVVLQPRFSASRYWPTALEFGATAGSQVIFTSRVLSQQPVPPNHRFRQWTDALCPPEFEALFGLRFVGGWGMTEVIAQAIVGDPWQPQRAGSIGRPSLGYAVHVLDDDGRPASPGQPGNLLIGGIRGLSLFKEYFMNPQANEEAFTGQGLFRTGDRVIVHEDGFIQFSERAKDLIKVGGEGVSPAEIERVVLEVPGVRETAVVAHQDKAYGEIPVAFVVLAPDLATSDTDAVQTRVIEHCRRSLAKFKVPREVVVLSELPRINFGKIAKVKLREWLQSRK